MAKRNKVKRRHLVTSKSVNVEKESDNKRMGRFVGGDN